MAGAVKVAIVGAGIIGNSAAWRLAKAGFKVTVVERGRIGQEASWAAAGMIVPQADAEGPGPFVDLCIRAREVFGNLAPQLIRESGIDPEIDDQGTLQVAADAPERERLKRHAQWHLTTGASVEEVEGAALRKLVPALAPEIDYALYFRGDLRADNRRLTQAYAVAASRAGVLFREETNVEAIEASGGKVRGLRLAGGDLLESDLVVDAAGSWSSQIRGIEPDGVILSPVRGQIVCFDITPGSIGPAILSGHGYIVPRRDGRLLAGTTREYAGYSKQVTMAGMEAICRCARALIPDLGGARFREAWAGLRPGTPDLLPVIGHSPTLKGLIYATGHYRGGILLSALTGELVAALAKGTDPGIDLSAFSPARFSAQGRKG